MRFRGWIATAAAGMLLANAAAAAAQDDAPRRAWLGFTYTANDRDGSETVTIEKVYPGSPAAEAGVRAGDRIVRWNGDPDVEQVLETLRLEPGDTVRLRVRRGDDRDRELLVVAAQRPDDMIARFEEREGPFRVSPEEWRENQEEWRAAQEALRRTQEEVARLWERNGRRMSPEEWKKWQEEFSEKQEELERLFRSRARIRGFQADSLARFWQERMNIDSLTFNVDSLQRRLRLRVREELGPQLRSLGDQFVVVVPEGTSRTVISLGNRAVAGAEFEEMNEGLASYFATDEGLLVLRVSRGTPAGRAGLEPGDVVLEANDRPVRTVEELRSAVARAEGGPERTVNLAVLRQGRSEEVVLRWE